MDECPGPRAPFVRIPASPPTRDPSPRRPSRPRSSWSERAAARRSGQVAVQRHQSRVRTSGRAGRCLDRPIRPARPASPGPTGLGPGGDTARSRPRRVRRCQAHSRPGAAAGRRTAAVRWMNSPIGDAVPADALCGVPADAHVAVVAAAGATTATTALTPNSPRVPVATFQRTRKSPEQVLGEAAVAVAVAR